MRLCDRIAQASEPLVIEDAAGLHEMPGPERDAAEIRSTPVRYVLDDRAREYCLDVLTLDQAMFVPENMALRMPAERFWVEWRSRPRDLNGRRLQSGVLVEASPDGRSGTARSFWMQEGGPLDRAQARVRFDLDEKVPAGPDAVRPTLHGLDELAPHLLAEVDPEWLAHLRRAGSHQAIEARRRIAAPLWGDLMLTFLFSSVLASRVFAPRQVSRGRLNVARAKRGRGELLDHVEVHLALANLDAASGHGASGQRAIPRLHLVRGHMVQRGGKQFWRSSHMRGDLAKRALTRTVKVTARR